MRVYPLFVKMPNFTDLDWKNLHLDILAVIYCNEI